MAKRIFVSFAMENRNLRDLFVGQARNGRTPFELIDMSVKEAWDNAWKTNCRARIKSCTGMVGLITADTAKADGQLWELKCALADGIPLLLINADGKSSRPPAGLETKSVSNWTWDNVFNFIERC
jgi:hypothetical protein